jgi:trehalose 6-phosphate synthase
LWFGWGGETVEQEPGDPDIHIREGVTYATIDLKKDEFELYYNGYANEVLWPLFHYFQRSMRYADAQRDAYESVNRTFAQKLAPLLEQDDVIWVHDYHLIPLAQLLRERGATCRLGFFLHVPMPSSDLLAALPDHRRLFEGLSAYDLVGFQTERDLERFQDYVRLFGRGRVVEHGVLETAEGRRLRAGAFPISIDTAQISGLASKSASMASAKRLATSLSGRALAIGVDRLDYSKGLPERFRAFERYLGRHPEQRGTMTYLQIAPVSRGEVPEYRTLRQELEQLAGHINGTHADADWTPVRYVNRNYPHATLAGFLRLARVALVTPLRDGMNLVAKEFVAAQDPEDPGVLVLSSFAGAARELTQALLVNPYDLDGVADAIAAAISMPLEERRERWQAMFTRLRQHDITAWRQHFLATLRAA